MRASDCAQLSTLSRFIYRDCNNLGANRFYKIKREGRFEVELSLQAMNKKYSIMCNTEMRKNIHCVNLFGFNFFIINHY